jgi:hypothetical protein
MFIGPTSALAAIRSVSAASSHRFDGLFILFSFRVLKDGETEPAPALSRVAAPQLGVDRSATCAGGLDKNQTGEVVHGASFRSRFSECRDGRLTDNP